DRLGDAWRGRTIGYAAERRRGAAWRVHGCANSGTRPIRGPDALRGRSRSHEARTRTAAREIAGNLRQPDGCRGELELKNLTPLPLSARREGFHIRANSPLSTK